ncbi:MAG: hypothetical protein NC084_01935 [Bacteroides sp.]|nr:hypothetical protein [Eubacterium sp.]MCM1417353.1 hypothetical protein [Roseburia sp.]MCM1461454.1 hypothetical protein [Bacteroides sp.]
MAEVSVGIAPSGITYTTDVSKLSWGAFDGGYVFPTLAKSDKGLTFTVGDDPVTVCLADPKISPDCFQYMIEGSYDGAVVELDEVEHYDKIWYNWEYGALAPMKSSYYELKSSEIERAIDAKEETILNKENELKEADEDAKTALNAEIEKLRSELSALQKELKSIKDDNYKSVYCFTISPKSVGKTSIVIKELVSGKKRSIKVTVKKAKAAN